MGKLVISKLFLYKNRFRIGYILLGLAFIVLLFGFPFTTPNGLSEAEMQSAVTSASLSPDASFLSGDIVDLPYHLLQKLSISIFGLTPYAIKLPSIIIGALLGFLLILLLNRWFKNNVAILACILTVLSSSFLYLAGSGTPLIMFVFWPTLLLWLGSKIQGIKKPRPFFSFVFAIALLGSIFTPFLIYLAAFIVIYVMLTPHLRFTVKSLPRIPLVIFTFIIVAGCGFIIANAVKHPTTIADLLFTREFGWGGYLGNIKEALTPFFAWNGMIESTFLAPLISLPTLALAVIGLFSTTRGFFASRNSIATYLIIFTVIISGLRPTYAILLILPFAILIAHGLRYILDRWYNIFPENPYARIFGILPISIFMSIMIISDLSHFFFGYRYNPPVASQFTSDLTLLDQTTLDGDILVVPEEVADFYKLYADIEAPLGNSKKITVLTSAPESFHSSSRLLTLGKLDDPLIGYGLTRIVTSDRSQNADRIYIYNVL